MTDSRSSLTAADVEAADWLRRSIRGSGSARAPPRMSHDSSVHVQHPPQAPPAAISVTVIANKCDNIGNSNLVATALEAVCLGLGNPVLYSAETQAGTADLYEALQPVIDAAETRHLQKSGAAATVLTWSATSSGGASLCMAAANMLQAHACVPHDIAFQVI